MSSIRVNPETLSVLDRPNSYIGKTVPRPNLERLLQGRGTYVSDMELPRMAHFAFLRSPHAHAKILKIDATAAKQMPGVVAVVTGKELATVITPWVGVLSHLKGLKSAPQSAIAIDRVCWQGEAVAAIVATSRAAAEDAAEKVAVEYEELEAVTDMRTALDPATPVIHASLGDNLAFERVHDAGAVDKAFAEADAVVETDFIFGRHTGVTLEPRSVVADWNAAEARLTIYQGTQAPHMVQNIAALHLGLRESQVRVVCKDVGGSFGIKVHIYADEMATYALSKLLRRPVKFVADRVESFNTDIHARDHRCKGKIGVKRDGTITAFEIDDLTGIGPYSMYPRTSAIEANQVVNLVGGPYTSKNYRARARVVFQNKNVMCQYRAVGHPIACSVTEGLVDLAAIKIGMDPVEFRRRNAICEGDTLAYGARMNPSGLHEAINRVAAEIRWGQKESSKDPHKVIGKGFACFWKAPAMPPNAASSAFIKFNEDGSLNISASGMEIGQGYLTVMAQIAAEILTVPVHRIRVEPPDTDRNAYEWQTVGSHVTWGCGNAVKAAAIEVREKMFDVVERALGLAHDTLYVEDEKVKCRVRPDFALPFKDFVISGIQTAQGNFIGGPILGSGVFMPEFTSALSDPETSQGGHPNVHYTVGAAAAILEVDKQTGRMRVLKAVLAVDAGKAIHPGLVKGQVVGGVLQGLATVLYEDIRYDLKGKLLNANFTDYKIPTALDVPVEIVPIIVEVAQPDGPFGARGIGEQTMIPAAAMIANAVDDAVGLRMKGLPITAEKVALELHGIRYDDVKGSYMGLCFAGQPDKYDFRTTTAKKK